MFRSYYMTILRGLASSNYSNMHGATIKIQRQYLFTNLVQRYMDQKYSSHNDAQHSVFTKLAYTIPCSPRHE